jgi:tetratricopeptide (TPR) repeat protein
MCVAALSLLSGGGAAAQGPASRTGEPPALSAPLQEVFNQGVQALQSGQLDPAEKAFLQVLKEGGRLPFVYNDLGIVYEQRGEREQALEQFREAIRLDSHYVAPRVLMGSTLLAMNRVREAARELEAAVRLEPGDPLAHLQLAKAYKRLEDYPRVVEQYQALEQLAPQDPEYVYQTTRAYLDLSAWCFQQIAHLQPNSARVYQAFGENFRAEGRPEIALRAFQHAAKADPHLPEIHLALAEIYFSQGKIPEAKKEVEQELAIVPASAAALALKKKLDTPSHN